MSLKTKQPRESLSADPLVLFLASLPLALSGVFMVGGVSDQDSMVLMAVLSFSCCAAILGRCYFRLGRTCEFPTVILVLAFLFWFYTSGLLTAWTDDQWAARKAFVSISNTDAMKAYFGVNTFFLGLCLAAQFKVGLGIALKLRHVVGTGVIHASKRNTTILVATLVVSLAFYVVVAGGIGSAVQHILSSRAEDQPWGHKGYEASGLTPLHVISTSLLVAVAACAMHIVLSAPASRGRKVVLVGTVFAAAGWVAVGTGTRSLLLGAFIPPVSLFVRRSVAERASVRYRRLVVVGAVVALLVLVASFQRGYRRGGTLRGGVEFSVEDNDFFTMTAYAFAVQERAGRHFHDSALLHIVTGPVPRALWKGKPQMDSMLEFTYYVWGIDVSERGGNTLPSIVGQYYMNWGWLGILELSLVLSIIVRVLDNVYHIRRNDDVAQLGVLAVSAYIFVSFRMLSFSYFSPMVTTILLARVLGATGAEQEEA